MSQASDYVPPPRSDSSNLPTVVILVVILVAFLGLGGWLILRAKESRDRAAFNVGGMKNLSRLAAAQVASQTPASTMPTDLTAQVDALLAKFNRPDSPGCAVGIVERGELIYSRGFGSADLEHRVANTPQTLFETASFGKSLTCFCVALLMDEGKLAPEDDIRKFVPELHAFDPPIRIQDLVRCRSGLWDQVSAPILVGWENAPLQSPHTKQDFFDLLIGQKALPFEPGTQFRYSSGDYFLLGLIVERVSGQPLAQFARERLFEPLGMTRTLIEVDPSCVIENRAVGHYKRQGHDWHLWRPTAYWAGGAGLKTCVEDLYRWDQNFAQPVPGPHTGELLREGTLLGNRNCLDVDAYRKETDPESGRDAPTGQYRGLRRRQFTGGAWGLTAALTQFPDQQLTVICLSNCEEIVAWTINGRIADLFLGDQLQPKPPKAAAPAASELPTRALDESHLQDKVGAYRMKPSGQIWRITLQDGALRLTDHLLKTHPLRPLSETTFDPEGPFYATTQFVFSRPSDDAPWTLTSQWDEPENKSRLEFDRVELVEPTPDQLSAYSGVYISDELSATYRLAVRDGQLWLRVNSRRWEQLDATVQDEFIPHLRDPPEARIIRFLRNDRDTVTGLTIDYYRVTGVRFTKQP